MIRPTALLRTSSVFLALAVALLAAGCAKDGPSPMPAVPHYDAETLREKHEAILALIADLSCTDTSQCHRIGVGTKACGGTAQYLVYSSAAVDEEALGEAVQDYNAYQAGYVAEHGSGLSDCMLTPEPVPACAANKCVAT
jgi:hypothetical protein